MLHLVAHPILSAREPDDRYFHGWCRAWRALESGMRCRALVVFIKGVCVFHHGAAKSAVDAGKSATGPICRKAMEEEKGNYLANLGLYPGAILLHDEMSSSDLPQ